MQVEQGQLRRFNSAVPDLLGGVLFRSGDLLVILKITRPRTSAVSQVSFLCNGQVEEGWGFPWISTFSEVVNEAG